VCTINKQNKAAVECQAVQKLHDSRLPQRSRWVPHSSGLLRSE